MNAELLPCVEVLPDGDANASVIWLHGLGADGHDFPPIVPHLGLPRELRVRFLFPHAPSIPVTINQGWVMPAWYDILSMDLGRKVDEAGVRASASRLRDLVARELGLGIPSRRIVVAGFSQGGAVALVEGLRHPEPLAGILALSTYLLLDDSLEAERSAANATVPVFQAHGTLDPMVPFAAGTTARDRLLKLGYPLTWREFPMQHEVCMEEIAEVGTWLARVLTAPLDGGPAA